MLVLVTLADIAGIALLGYIIWHFGGLVHKAVKEIKDEFTK